MPRYLTKSRFKLGQDCPTKLYYTKKDEYLDTKLDDSFLAALSEGGFQVGELAKCYYPGGHDITSLDYEEAESQTNELLKQENVIIYEPAIKFKNLFIRIDILIKRGSHFELIEVKAKSFDSNDEQGFLTKSGKISSSWRAYLEDVAFQKHVLSEKYSDFTVDSYLMLSDKNSKCHVDGLNQKFRIVRDESNRTGIKVSNTLNKEDLKKKILIKVPVDDEVDLIMEDGNFLKSINELSSAYKNDKKILPNIGAHCGSCEFQCSIEEEEKGYKNGFKECWKEVLEWDDSDFNEPNILEIWSSRRKDKFIEEGKLKLTDLVEDDVEPAPDGRGGISSKERQWLQVEKVQNKDDSPYFDSHGLKLEMEKWTYPLHFIDFETSMVAIPFNKGRRPYEAIAFQFSHHIIYEDGRVEHAGEYLNTNVGEFPNYEFLRELKRQLEEDTGTIFRYSPHENTFLNHIYRQLREDESDIPDREELCEFIKTITTSSSSMAEKWEGDRNMVDLWDLVKRYYYDPATRGSNSIKAVLPAILNSSDFLQEKYGQPIYGTEKGIKSLNFKDWQWLEIKDGKVIDPYKKLPKMFTDVSDKNLEILTEDDELANGGAALTAYGRMQFSEMSEIERSELSSALLRYCELDTMAMVMIFEAWAAWAKYSEK
ncbi:hypothetical protein BIY24_03805 [Halobacteriovorax marinus]|uniref:DUF2779 domain-containing protein n=1 Tax=Halobacteriovorax marinus TaxID=97084 RepID=UPI000BC3101A|nr:DUF2779 domain-containing protein [Halobacteriovorax marinus]ATH07091.1 hypothetical protein BIY24_03805 [Halobacteriovorax marinus]